MIRSQAVGDDGSLSTHVSGSLAEGEKGVYVTRLFAAFR